MLNTPETQAPSIYHSRDCMDAWMLPCRCGAEANQARAIPSTTTNPAAPVKPRTQQGGSEGDE